MRAAVLFVLVGMLAMLALVTPVAAESPVKNLVFVMLENRGFDHRLGYLKSLYPELDGLNGNESNFVNPKLRTGLCKVNDSGDPYGSPNGGHSYHSTLNEQYGTTDVKPPYSPPPMDGFALNENSCDVMESIPVDDIPVSRSFIDNFMILDKWFPGFPGPTEVNRMHFHSGTSEGWCDNPTDEEYVIGYPQESLVHHLEANNITWRVYMSDMVSTLLMFKDVRSPHMLKNFHSYERFKQDAARGELPQYSLIEPRFFSVKGLPSNDEHPKEHCIYQGELLYKSIYDNLRASPQWNTSALLITYDEHGGLYDHVPSPTGVPPPSPGLNCSRKGGDPYYDYTRLGIRVPAFLISPWVKKGHIEHYPNTGKTTPPPGAPQYTHSTQLATCRDVFGIPGNLTTRVSWAASLAPLFTEKEARTDAPMTMPQPPKGTPEQISKMDNEWKQPINHLQEDLMRQMAALNGRLLSEETQLPQTEAEGSEYALGHYEAFRKSLGL